MGSGYQIPYTPQGSFLLPSSSKDLRYIQEAGVLETRKPSHLPQIAQPGDPRSCLGIIPLWTMLQVKAVQGRSSSCWCWSVTCQLPSLSLPCCALILMPQWSQITHRKEISSFHHSSPVVLGCVESPSLTLSAMCHWVYTQKSHYCTVQAPLGAEAAQAGAGHSDWAGWKFWHSPCLLDATKFLPRKVSLPLPQPCGF